MIRTWVVLVTFALVGCADRTGAPSAGDMESAAAARSPVVGREAPGFTLQNDEGQPVELAGYRGRWVVLYFYPQSDTPGCTCQATEFTGLLQSFRDLNAAVVGVSPDTPGNLERFRYKYDLKLDLLSDPTRRVMREYGASAESRLGEETYWRIIRSTYLIDPEGKIAHHWPEVIPEGHAERVREKLAELAG